MGKRTIEVSDETYEMIKDKIASEYKPATIQSTDGLIGGKWFFRTATYHMVGRVNGIVCFGTNLMAHLVDASWIADSGRFMQFIKEGKLNEVEPVGECYVNLSTVIDMYPWVHALPKEQK